MTVYAVIIFCVVCDNFFKFVAIVVYLQIKECPKRRQTMLFSATMTEEVGELIKLSMNKPMRLSADPSTKRPAKLTEE